MTKVLIDREALQRIHRDLDACQKVIWLAGGFDPAYCRDAQARLKEIDELLEQPAQAQAAPQRVNDELFVSIRQALDYSRNFANAKPDIGTSEREHILGLANLLERTARSPAQAGQEHMTVAAMCFEYKHPDSGEERAVVITRDDVLTNMEFELFEKLLEQLCQCEPIGETNIIDCGCDEHADEFVLLSDRPTAHPTTMTLAATDVLAERRRQIEAEGWTPEHDDEHSGGQMARAGACYALSGSCPPSDETAALLVDLAWPWAPKWWRPTTQRRDLVKAAALILAEIERLDRTSPTQGGEA